MSETAIANKEIPPPAPPSFGELIGLSLTALLNAPGVFLRLSERPAPRRAAVLSVAFAWGGAFFALNLIHAALAYPVALEAYQPWQIALVGFFAILIWSALYLIGVSLAYALGRTLGSAGDFNSALLIGAVTFTAAPVQALCSWYPLSWLAPVLAAWMLACGLISLFKASAWPARGAGVVLAAVLYGAGLAVEHFQLAAFMARSAPSSAQSAVLEQQMQQLAPLLSEIRDTAPNGQAGQSSLDLLRGSAAAESTTAPPTSLQQLSQLSAQGDALNKSVISMLDSIAPMLNNPLVTRGMTPLQKSDYATLKNMIQELRGSMLANARVSPQEQQAKMLKIQELVMRVMSAGINRPHRAGDDK